MPRALGTIARRAALLSVAWIILGRTGPVDLVVGIVVAVVVSSVSLALIPSAYRTVSAQGIVRFALRFVGPIADGRCRRGQPRPRDARPGSAGYTQHELCRTDRRHAAAFQFIVEPPARDPAPGRRRIDHPHSFTRHRRSGRNRDGSGCRFIHGDVPDNGAMTGVYIGAALVILLASSVGLVIVRPRSMADRMLAVQLIGSSVVAVSLILSVATANAALLDVALLAALLAAFSACALRVSAAAPSRPPG